MVQSVAQRPNIVCLSMLSVLLTSSTIASDFLVESLKSRYGVLVSMWILNKLSKASVLIRNIFNIWFPDNPVTWAAVCLNCSCSARFFPRPFSAVMLNKLPELYFRKDTASTWIPKPCFERTAWGIVLLMPTLLSDFTSLIITITRI